jgi:hypothetical protein
MSFGQLTWSTSLSLIPAEGCLRASCPAWPTGIPPSRCCKCFTQAQLFLLWYALLQAEVSQTLCCLAIPADMSVANFCTFIGAYLGEVRSMQVRQAQPAAQQLLTAISAAPASRSGLWALCINLQR